MPPLVAKENLVMMLIIFVLSPGFLLSLELFRSLSFACKLSLLFVGGSEAARPFAFFYLSFEFGLPFATAEIRFTGLSNLLGFSDRSRLFAGERAYF